MDTENALLRLRSAFRYGFFAFNLALAGLFAAVCLSIDRIAPVGDSMLLLVPGLLGMVGLGLIVPLFLLGWWLAGSAVLNAGQNQAGPTPA
jgi:hypothetical protein